MSTPTTTAPAVGGSDTHPRPTPLQGRPGVPFSRTLQAELRKMVDTRAGRWMVIVMAAVAAIILAAFLIWGPAEDASFRSLLELSTLPLAMLLPVLGIMAATAEWTQRTGLVTFTLEPRRGRVVLAKALAALVLAAVVLVVAVAASAVANIAGGTGEWDLTAAVGGGVLLALLIYVLQGVAFGLLFLNTPVAIVSVLVLPTIWSIATMAVSSLEEAGRWLNLDSVMQPLFAGEMAGQDWAQLATASGVWVLLPLVVGTWRVLTREVK
ncbi:ABC-type transport system involved in multi-copper enzyme maturation permease subunit [Nocardioides cavernae]|uniref:ABC-type transport system involved in multi-copper enzyme maturation permease subunit n=1 Tax=Nocardioides cavernae TaxID=1921566 RepID=A0A7Y9KSJ6_9ACTN|nr:ABC transporter permease [Nocardioides cavernae]NYE37664.1 ABC-type transport system involved in multi-copper enzyme maturation permease subunit [Nocardioides cavernae]